MISMLRRWLSIPRRLEGLQSDLGTVAGEVARSGVDMTHAISLLASELKGLQRDLSGMAGAMNGLLQGQGALLPGMSEHFSRNFLPNDHGALQKTLMELWALRDLPVLNWQGLQASGFRVFSQNDEDGVLLRLFSHIGCTNRRVVEIGSNCSGSDLGIPENLSCNLIIHHGWHGSIVEMDALECSRIRHFFARDYATKHFHFADDRGGGYLSPLVLNRMVTPGNINHILAEACGEDEPDLLVLDIDGGDFEVASAVSVRPRVFVVEFERRFRDRHAVVQKDRNDFGVAWPQSGSTSLPAWEILMAERGYVLCTMASSAFNAVFVRNDVAAGKLLPTTSSELFQAHPIYSRVNEEFWISPDETWSSVV
ncbi:MAG: hypothetical protein REI09_09100 [Candidatus Dactylopiibacterium sp.]|nr:hypothetical protein [Candidatus Dactylopiibacterium sp.]